MIETLLFYVGLVFFFAPADLVRGVALIFLATALVAAGLALTLAGRGRFLLLVALVALSVSACGDDDRMGPSRVKVEPTPVVVRVIIVECHDNRNGCKR